MPLILIADDDQDLGTLLKQGLEVCGYKVRTARNGVEALSLLGEADTSAVMELVDLGAIEEEKFAGKLTR